MEVMDGKEFVSYFRYWRWVEMGEEGILVVQVSIGVFFSGSNGEMVIGFLVDF